MRSPILVAVLLLGTLSVLVIGGVFLLRGVGQRSPADLLPADTMAMVESRDVPRLWRALARTRLGAEEGEGWPSPIDESIDMQLRQRGLPFGFDEIDLQRGVPGEAILALVPADGRRGDPERGDLVLLLRFGRGSERAIDAVGRAIRERLAPLGGVWGSREYHGREYETLGLADGRRSLAFAALHGVVAIAGSTRLMHRLIDTGEGAGPSLGADADYRFVRGHLDRRADLVAYASSTWITATFAPQETEAILSRRLARLMGIDAVRAAGLALDLRKGTFEERLFLAMTPGGRGLPGKLFDAPPRDNRDLHLLPGEFPFHLALTFSSLDAVYERLPVILGETTTQPSDAIRERMRGFEDFLAIDPERELLAGFGERATASFGSASLYPRGAANRLLQNVPMVLSIETRGDSRIAGALNRVDGLARMLGAYRKEAMPEGGAVTWYDLPSLAPLRPAWRLARNSLVVATSPDLLDEDDPGTARSGAPVVPGAVEQALERLPRRAHAVFVGDSARILDLIGGNSALPPSLAQRLETLAGATDLPPTAVAVTMTAEGLRIEAVSPVSPSLLVFLLAGGAGER